MIDWVDTYTAHSNTSEGGRGGKHPRDTDVKKPMSLLVDTEKEH